MAIKYLNPYAFEYSASGPVNFVDVSASEQFNPFFENIKD